MNKGYSIRLSRDNRFVASVIGYDVTLDTEENRMTVLHHDAAEKLCAFCEEVYGDKFQIVEETPMTVCIRVDGRVLVTVNAVNPNNHDAIIEAANRAVSDMDFGELEDIDWDAVYIENEDGDRVWECD